jgi:CAI-1 autoinducer synthase
MPHAIAIDHAQARTFVLPAEQQMPEFVTRRMDEHYITRIEQLLGGEHPHAWQPTPAGAVFLAGNDYLCLAGEPALVGAQIAALRRGPGELLMSAVFLQAGSQQHRLEEKFADFMGAQETSWRSPAGRPTSGCCRASPSRACRSTST